MSIEYTENRAIFQNIVNVDEAETLLVWLQKKKEVQIDFSDCTSLHPATLQVVMAVNPKIFAWPKDTSLSLWIKSAFEDCDEGGNNGENNFDR